MISIDLMCNARLNYYVRVWNQITLRGCIDIPVKDKDAGLSLISAMMKENPELVSDYRPLSHNGNGAH